MNIYKGEAKLLVTQSIFISRYVNSGLYKNRLCAFFLLVSLILLSFLSSFIIMFIDGFSCVIILYSLTGM